MGTRSRARFVFGLLFAAASAGHTETAAQTIRPAKASSQSGERIALQRPKSELQSPACGCTASCRCGPAYAETANFIVHSASRIADARQVARQCETLRAQLQQQWAGGESDGAWQPRCYVIVHGSQEAYLSAVGRGGASTSGASSIALGQGGISSRRIDLQAYGHREATSALAHELTHVVLADQFGGRQPPRWADEGIATWADAADKQRLHRRDFHVARKTGSLLPLGDLLTRDTLRPDEMAAFYGQSLMLVDFLATRDQPEKVTELVKQSLQHGYDLALRDVYNINGVAELDRLWRQSWEEAAN